MSFRPKLTAASVAAALLFSGCANMDGLTSRASQNDPAHLSAAQSLAGAKLSAAAWPNDEWWKRFGDPQLDRLMAEALAGSPSLRVAQARARKALAVARIADAARYPQVNANAQYTRERLPEHYVLPPPLAGSVETQAELQATLAYDVDVWGKNAAAAAAAIGQAKAAEVDAYAARLALSSGVAQAYVQLAHAWEQLDVAEHTLRQREQLHTLTLERFNAGLDTRLALKQTEAALPASREQIAQLHEAIDLARNQLAALLGQGPDRGLAIERPRAAELAAAELPSYLPAELIGRRPDVVAQRWRVEAASREVDVAKAQFYPDINLAAFIGYQSIGLAGLLQSRTAGIGPALTLPIFDAGQLRGNLAASHADYDVAVETYNQTLADALRDVVDQLASFRSVTEQRKQQRLALAATQAAYDLALQRFREGVGNYLEVLTAEAQLLAQQSLEVDLRARSLNLSINLNRALGGGFASSPASQLSAR